MSNRIEQPPLPPQNLPPQRRAEQTDTQQAIVRHDPDFHRKKKNDDEGGFKDPYEDLTDVSVPALRNFLEGLLDKIDPGHATAAQPAPHMERAPASPQAAAAMSAYQTRAGTTPPAIIPPSQPAAAPATALDQAAAGLDRDTVIALIRDLDRLAAKGVESIALEKGDGFLASIRASVDRAMDAGI